MPLKLSLLALAALILAGCGTTCGTSGGSHDSRSGCTASTKF